MMKKNPIAIILVLIMVSCINKAGNNKISPQQKKFSPDSLLMKDFKVKEIKGQLLYLPVYSNIPYQIDTLLFDMSAFVAIHNTDLYHPINLTRVLYFNQTGELVDDFLGNKTITINPLATKDFYIPYEDKSGTGANFLVEWIADTLVTEPLIESVTICLKSNNTVAVLSQGKIIREKR